MCTCRRVNSSAARINDELVYFAVEHQSSNRVCAVDLRAMLRCVSRKNPILNYNYLPETVARGRDGQLGRRKPGHRHRLARQRHPIYLHRYQCYAECSYAAYPAFEPPRCTNSTCSSRSDCACERIAQSPARERGRGKHVETDNMSTTRQR